MALPNKIFGWLRAFDADERGVAMTEFIITLPVFILIFAGLLNLYRIERRSVEVKMLASKDMWKNAMSAAKDTSLIPSPSRGIPMIAGMDAVGTISQYPSEHGDMFGTVKDLGLMSNATQGEAERSTLVLSIIGESPSGNAPGQSLSAYPRDMLDDSRWNMITSAPGPLARYFPVIPLSFIGPNQVPAAGLRYGTSAGYHELQARTSLGQATYKAAYDVGNSPVKKPTWHDPLFVPGFSRLMAEDDPCLSNVLELSTDMGYTSNCF